MPDFSFDQLRPPLGDGVTVLLIAAAAGAVLWLYLTRTNGTSWFKRLLLLLCRLGAVAVAAWILMGPSAETTRQRPPQRLPVLMLADTSASMAQRDVEMSESDDGPITRFAAVQRTWLDPEYLAQLREQADVRLLAFDQGHRALSVEEAQTLTPEGDQTLLFGSVRAAVESQTPHLPGETSGGGGGLVVVLSDGHDTQRQVDPAFAVRMMEAGWRIVTVPVGSPLGVRYVSVDASAEADFLFENQSTWINVQVQHSGFVGRPVQVDLEHEGRLIASQTVTFQDEQSRTLRFRVTPPAPTARGSRIEGYRVTARPLPLPGELDDALDDVFLENNSRWVFLQVSTDRIKVAMFEAEPYWDTKFLARVLREDPQIELTSVYSLATGRIVTVQSNVKSGTVLGATEENFDPQWLTAARLNEFDVIILGKGAERFFGNDRAQWLVDYVRQHGGALVLARGQAFNLADPAGLAAQRILSVIEPVEWGVGTLRDLALEVAPEGRSSQLLQFDRLGSTDAVLSELPDMLAATRIRREKSLSIVLLRQAPMHNADGQTPAQAAIAHTSAGAGRVLAVLSDGMWRWAFLPSSLRQYDSVYQAFWAKTIRWLATGGQFLPGQSMSLSLSALKVESGETVQVTVNTRYVEPAEFSPRVQIIAPDGQAQDLTLARHAEQSTQFDGVIRLTEPGVHEVVLYVPGDDGAEATKITGRLAVHDRSAEKRDPSARPQVLAEMAEATGGRCFDLSQRDELPRFIGEMTQARQTDPTWDYVFNREWVFALLAALLGIEWIVRRRSGMV